MKEIVDSYFRDRSLVNHQIASFDDCITARDGRLSRMERIVRNIRIGTDEKPDDGNGGIIKLDVIDQEIYVRIKNIILDTPVVKEANGAQHPATPVECRLRKLTYQSPILMDCVIYKDGVALPAEKRITIGNMPIMVRSERCNVHPRHVFKSANVGTKENVILEPQKTQEDSERYNELLKKAGEDPLDPGGYFIINGTERALISVEDLAPNRVTVELNTRYTKNTEVAKIFSQKDGVRKPLTVEKRRDGMLLAKISTVGTTPIPVVLLMRALGITQDQEIFRAIAGPHETFKFIVANINEVNDQEEYGQSKDMESALDWLQKKFAAGQQREFREARVQQLLDRELLPHLGDSEEARMKKAIYLGRIVRQVLEMAITNRKPNDKDHYANKRVRLAGDLMEDLFRVSMNQLARDLKYQLERHHNRKRDLKISSCLRPDVLTSKIMHALATGNWVGGRSGVSQLLDRTTFLSALSHMRRVTSPLVRSQPHFEARDLHPTQWGRLCPNETPEGQNCGLVKNAAQMIDVSEDVPVEDVKLQLKEMDVFMPEDWSDGSRIHVDGDIYGLHKRPKSLVNQFKNARRRGRIRPEVSIRHDSENKDIFINTDKGRILRPLLVIDGGSLKVNNEILNKISSRELEFKDLVSRGYVEWIDADEEEDQFIASRPFILPQLSPKSGLPMSQADIRWTNIGEERATTAKISISIRLPSGKFTEEKHEFPLAWSKEDENGKLELNTDYTHLEIDPQLILGVCASLIPYPEHNSTPRVTGGTAMVKQSLGLPSSNFMLRPDTRLHVLHYPQNSIVGTRAMESTGFLRRPGGQNYVVAVMSHHGYNMQDAVIINKGSIDRGLGRSTFLRTYNSERRRYPGRQFEEIEVPGSGLVEVKGLRPPEAYAHLESDGLSVPEVELKGGEVIVGKTSPPRFLEETGTGGFLQAHERRESSMLIRHGEKGYVANVFVTESLESGRLIRSVVRTNKIPEVGDKFASRHGQKGVIGRLVPPEDMPFTRDGVVPDLIINPHAIPSRMTVAHVMEMIGGKVGAMEGRFIDGTAFVGEKESSLREGLVHNGFHHSGRETMYNGETGEIYPVDIFVGVIYYQKLHHMVSGKIHARSRGRVQILTRQPTEGRARQGGLRFGEMERDCLIAHGASMVIKDRLLDESDGIEMFVCGQSGHIAWYDPKKRTYVSPIHGEGAEVYKVQTSYAFKLLLDEMKSLGVAMRLKLEDRR